MSDLLTQGIVCVLSNDGSVGTGFVVSESGLIATCSHVIQPWQSQEVGNPLPEKVRILFYATGDELDARVEPIWWLPYNAGDLAVLRLDGKLPQGIQPLPLGSAQGTNGHPICTFGFPELRVSGIGGDGKVVRSLTARGLSLLQLSSHEITEGFSGAPVWNTLTRRVIGIVSAVTIPDSNFRLDTTAFAVATEMLQNLCTLLRVSDVCPYLGLDTFQETHAEFFFGRQTVVDRILNRLRQEPRFLTIVGASGSGKSSIIQAGLIPQLKKGMVPHSDCWEVIVLRPVNDSLADLIPQTSASGDNTLQEQVGTWLRLHSERERCVIIFDQFEELFLPDEEAQRQNLLGQIIQLLQSSLPVSVILVMRDDFYSRMLQFEALVPWIEQGQGPLHIPQTLKQDELKVIIQKPAEVVGLRFEEGLVELIVKDIIEATLETGDDGQAGRSAILPLLEAALYELWKRRQDGMLTHNAYKMIGSVTGALPQWADRALSELQSDAHKRLVRRIFTDLVYLGDQDQGMPDIKRRRTLDALCRQNTEQHDVGYIIHHLEQPHHRLLISGQNIQTGKETVELIHDILIYTWGNLKAWIRADRAFLLWRQEIEQPLQIWKEKRDKNKLLRGHDLREAKKWLKDRPSDFSQDEVAFLRASIQQRINLLVRLSLVIFLFLALTGAAGWFYSQQAANPTLVTALQDGVSGSLRYCVDNAPTGSTIRFAQGMRGRTIQLTKGDLVFTSGKHLTIAGPGANQLTISGAGAIIHMFRGATLNISGLSFKNSETVNDAFLFNEGTLTISSSIISGNKTTDASSGLGNGLGGGINNSGTLTVTNNTIISNNSISGSGTNQGGGINNSGKLTLVNSTVSNNEATSSGDSLGFGGGIYNTETGTLIVTSSVISGNKAGNDTNGGFGGGIENAGTLTVTNSTFSGNLVTGNPIAKGGGISNDGQSTVTHSTFMNNTANSSGSSGFGGGIENGQSGALTVTNSTFSANMASGKQGGEGGGIGNGGKLSVTESAFSKNSASSDSAGFGGGIYNLPKGTLMVTNSTFSANTASGKQGAGGGGIGNAGKLSVTESIFSKNSTSGSGGGILSATEGSSATIRFCTIYENTSNTGGGILVDPRGSSQMTIGDNIIAANSALRGPDISGPVISGGYNLIENTAGVTGLNTNVDRQVALADLKIDTTLGNNEGPTQTLALLPGSVAIDAVPLQACSITITDPWNHTVTITTDQRGDPRPDGSENMCDMGAYESSY